MVFFLTLIIEVWLRIFLLFIVPFFVLTRFELNSVWTLNFAIQLQFPSYNNQVLVICWEISFSVNNYEELFKKLSKGWKAKKKNNLRASDFISCLLFPSTSYRIFSVNGVHTGKALDIVAFIVSYVINFAC